MRKYTEQIKCEECKKNTIREATRAYVSVCVCALAREAVGSVVSKKKEQEKKG